MLDFTSSLYLGIAHPSSRLPGSGSLTIGAPAALDESPVAGELARRVALWIDVPAARLATSTLHAFVDLAAALSRSRPNASIAVDVAAYPIGRLGLSSTLCRPGLRFTWVAHHHVASARRWAQKEHALGRTPVLLVDGWCPGCGRVAPIGSLNSVMRSNGGLLIVDDTQAIGLLGAGRSRANPWGRGGGGSVVSDGSPPGVVVVASLAKALGSPLAVIAGPGELVRSTWNFGPTVVHSSPPAIPVRQAAVRALDINESRGNALRDRLLALLDRLLGGLSKRKVPVDSARFPIVRIPFGSGEASLAAVTRLQKAGVRALALGPSCQGRPAVGLALNAKLRFSDVDLAAQLIAATMNEPL